VSKVYFYELIVKTKTKGLDVFTYKSELFLPKFTLVEVDFNKRKVLGLVLKKLLRPNFDPKRIKEIIRVIGYSSLLDDQSLELAQFASNYYYTSFSKVVFWALPKIARRLAQKNLLQKEQNKISAATPTPVIPARPQRFAQQFGQAQTGIHKAGKPLFLQADIWQRLDYFKKEIKKSLDQGKQVLLLAPNLESFLVKDLVKEFLHFIISNKGKISECYQLWQKVSLLRQPALIIGSQKALFLPFKNLDKILVEDEGNPSFKQEQDPKIEVSHLSKELAKIRGAKLILASLVPKPETYLEIKKKKISFKSLLGKEQVSIADLAKESRLLAFSTEIALKKILDKNKKAIIFFNRLGLARLSLCPDCGFSIDSCAKNSNFAICPICSSVKIKSHSFGLERMVYDLKKIFPQSKIADLSKVSFTSKVEDITVATSFAFKFKQKLNLAVLGLAEIGLSLADPQISYKIFHFSLEALSRGEKKILQTFSFHHPLMQAITHFSIREFYNFWFSIRKDFKLYPYYKNIRLDPLEKNGFLKIEKELLKIKEFDAFYKLQGEKGEYFLLSFKGGKEQEKKLRQALLKLPTKITVNPLL